jgi:hypothetical protein
LKILLGNDSLFADENYYTASNFSLALRLSWEFRRFL